MRVVEMPGLQGDGGQRGLARQRTELRRKDDVRQENHGNNHTESRKPVNLGNNALCMTHSLWCVRCLKEEEALRPTPDYIHAAKPHCHVGGGLFHHNTESIRTQPCHGCKLVIGPWPLLGDKGAQGSTLLEKRARAIYG